CSSDLRPSMSRSASGGGAADETGVNLAVAAGAAHGHAAAATSTANASQALARPERGVIALHGPRADGVLEIVRVEAVEALLFRLRARIHEEADLRRSEEHTSELQSREKLVCRLLLGK